MNAWRWSNEGIRGIKRVLTIQHVDHYAGRIRVAGNAGVISAVGQAGLCHQKSARRAASCLLGLQGNSAPAVNAKLSKILCYYSHCIAFVGSY